MTQELQMDRSTKLTIARRSIFSSKDLNNDDLASSFSSVISPSASLDSGVFSTTSRYGLVWKSKMKQRQTRLPLRCYARLAVICIRLFKQSLDNLARARGEYESVMQVLDEYGAKITFGGLAFSPKDYRANKQQCLSITARKLLEQEPSTRTEDEITLLLVALRNIPAFAEYPKKMQRRLCQVGRFETFEPRRVVLREGDPPRSFYFILAGTVLVTAYEEMSGTSRTLVSLTKGMSFGELAVISNTRRQATVCSKTDIELLSISGLEFEEIFMAGGRDILANEKQRQFIESVGFLRHWPTERLKGDPQACTVYYFDRNQVLVRDSNNSDWIYIVLKGSLSVIKKLKRVEAQSEPCTPRKKPRISLGMPKPHSYNRNHSYNQNGRFNQRTSNSISTDRFYDSNIPDFISQVSSSCVEVFKNPYEVESKLEQTLPGYHNSQDRLGILDYDKIIQNYRARVVPKGYQPGGRKDLQGTDGTNHLTDNDTELQNENISAVTDSRSSSHTSNKGTSNDTRHHKTSFALPDIAQNNKTVQNHAQESDVKDGQSYRRVNGYSDVSDADDEQGSQCSDDNIEARRRRRKRRHISKTSKGVYLAPSRHRKNNRKQIESSPEPMTSPEPVPNDDVKADENLQQANKEESVSEKLAKLQIRYQRRVIDREGRKTVAEELDHKARRDFRFTEADLDPTIIQLQVLERGQYFGVTPLVFHDQPSLSVVSNGAECLVLSKRLFMLWASEKCLRHLRQTESPYPGDQELSRKLQEVVNWQANRATIYRHLEKQIREKQAKRKQFLPAYQGQYCFRTGPT